MKRATILLSSLLLLVAGGIGFWIGRSTLRVLDPSQEQVRLEQENQRLQTTLDDLSRENAALRNEANSGTPATGVSGKHGQRQIEGNLASDAEVVRGLQESLAAANEAASLARTRIKELETELAAVREEQTRLATANAEREAQIASAKTDAENKALELTRKSEQIAQLETANKKLREESGTLVQKASRQTQLLSQLQELYRRRESYLTTMVSRYREITDQYRAFASVLENRRGPEGTPGAGISIAGPELGRIQTSISLAEEDLRQLNALNAQVAKLQKDLSVK